MLYMCMMYYVLDVCVCVGGGGGGGIVAVVLEVGCLVLFLLLNSFFVVQLFLLCLFFRVGGGGGGCGSWVGVEALGLASWTLCKQVPGIKSAGVLCETLVLNLSQISSSPWVCTAALT